MAAAKRPRSDGCHVVGLEPLGGEAVGAQGVVLVAELGALVGVGGEAQAALPPDGVATGLDQPVEGGLRPAPVRLGLLGSEPLAGTVVRHRAAAQREAAVAAARPFGDAAGLVHTDAHTRTRERESAGARR